MRTIKFRAWDKIDKVMRVVYGIQFPKISNHGNRGNTIIEMHCGDYDGQKAIILSDFTSSVERVELMQYTGLKDKNGKEIYEGDIVEQIGELSKIKSSHKVLYKEKAGAFLLDGCFEFAHCLDNIEVIGNIYENPELLK